MPLFRISDDKFTRLTPNIVGKEKDLQHLIEANLLEALDIHFLEREYATTTGGRIDTLGVDRNGAPTIIEYKRNQNDNVKIKHSHILDGSKPRNRASSK
jgi:RecB family endonuclease NucS